MLIIVSYGVCVVLSFFVVCVILSFFFNGKIKKQKNMFLFTLVSYVVLLCFLCVFVFLRFFVLLICLYDVFVFFLVAKFKTLVD